MHRDGPHGRGGHLVFRRNKLFAFALFIFGKMDLSPQSYRDCLKSRNFRYIVGDQGWTDVRHCHHEVCIRYFAAVTNNMIMYECVGICLFCAAREHGIELHHVLDDIHNNDGGRYDKARAMLIAQWVKGLDYNGNPLETNLKPAKRN